jgi:hypothetical protein
VLVFIGLVAMVAEVALKFLYMCICSPTRAGMTIKARQLGALWQPGRHWTRPGQSDLSYLEEQTMDWWIVGIGLVIVGIIFSGLGVLKEEIDRLKERLDDIDLK